MASGERREEALDLPTALPSEKEGAMKRITKQKLQDMLLNPKEHFLFINVLPEAQYETERIPGSLNIPVRDENFLDCVKERVISKGQKIVVYCKGSDCMASAEAVEKLEKAGFSNVFDYRGGTKDWFSQHLIRAKAG